MGLLIELYKVFSEKAVEFICQHNEHNGHVDDYPIKPFTFLSKNVLIIKSALGH